MISSLKPSSSVFDESVQGPSFHQQGSREVREGSSSPSNSKPEVQGWVRPKLTKQQLNYVDLEQLDFSLFDKPDGKKILADKLHSMIKRNGFWAITNHGIPQKEIDRQFALAKHFFDHYSLEEKSARTVDFPNGDYLGYKKAGDKKFLNTEILTNNELLNIAKFTKDKYFDEMYLKQEFIQTFRDELEDFSRKSWGIIRKLMILFAIILELEDEEYFVKKDLYDDVSDDHYRFMQYHPRSKEDDAKVENIWSRPHTDFGTLTLLYNQLVVGLQIKDETTDTWRYVKPVENAIICNIADTLSFYSNNYFKSTIHRVLRPPEDQLENNAPRIGIFYFARLSENSTIEVAPSPLLKRLGLYKELKPISGRKYVQKRVQDYFRKDSIEKRVGKTFKFGAFSIRDGFE